jgi:hypothetical protein
MNWRLSVQTGSKPSGIVMTPLLGARRCRIALQRCRLPEMVGGHLTGKCMPNEQGRLATPAPWMGTWIGADEGSQRHGGQGYSDREKTAWQPT